MEIVINADALYASTPVIEAIKDQGANYIFKVQLANHKTLSTHLNNKTKLRIVVESRRENQVVIEWVNDIELFSSTKTKTNYIEAWELVPQKDGKTKSQYYGKWITNIDMTKENAKEIVDSGRARWKIENECFNTLKNHGYNIEHSYGHGSNNLCYNFYNLTLLAFTFHQIHQLTDKLFQAMRNKFGRLGSMWEEMRSIINLFGFNSPKLASQLSNKMRDTSELAPRSIISGPHIGWIESSPFFNLLICIKPESKSICCQRSEINSETLRPCL